MRFLTFQILPLLCFSSLAHAAPTLIVALEGAADEKPAAFFLAGDSTTAKQSNGGGGWGNGFLSYLEKPSIGTNYGHNGATTVSFKSGGDWEKVISDVKKNAGSHRTFVTIQFGHNDQKKDKNISEGKFQSNLEELVREVKSAGGTAILVTPLTRRSFSGPKLKDDLARHSELTIAAAKSAHVKFIDLHKASMQYVNAIGEGEASKFDAKSGDHSHLNAHGSVVFGRIVADLITAEYPELKRWIKKNDALTAAIKAGKYA